MYGDNEEVTEGFPSYLKDEDTTPFLIYELLSCKIITAFKADRQQWNVSLSKISRIHCWHFGNTAKYHTGEI
jgi:hypothetical protein